MSTATMPLLLGYQLVRLGTTREQLAAGGVTLARFAREEGYALFQIFIEHDMNKPTSALVALIDTAKRDPSVAAIAVPSPSDLGRQARVQRLMKARIEFETHVPVLIVEPESSE